MSIYSLLLVLVTTIECYIIKDLTQNALRFGPKNVGHNITASNSYEATVNFKKKDISDIELAKMKAKVIQAARKKEKKALRKTLPLSNVVESKEKLRFLPDTLLNFLVKSRRIYDDDNYQSSDITSSSQELTNWKDEWKEHWLQKKFEAINSTVPRGDIVNIAAARPWGLPCGDPNQHDMPWGTCMLPMECEAEYRIYRGDYFCGRTQFICCALQLTTYDMYQGFDVSFADSSLATDSEEKKNRNRGSKERRRRQKERDKRKRKKERMKRKRKMKRNIKRIVQEIHKILNRSYRNGTTERKRKTRQLKKFVKLLKKKYKEERKVVIDLHEWQLIQADLAVQERLNQIKGMNRDFVKNGTFRDIVVNGTANMKKRLRKGIPRMQKILKTRRDGAKPPRDYLNYDIEYGYLYY